MIRALLVWSSLAAPVFYGHPTCVAAQETVIEDICRDQLGQMIEEDAAYQPGIDVDGKAVVSADVNAPLKAQSYPVKIPVEISLIKWMNMNVDPALRLDPEVAYFMLHEDGRIEYNGQNVSSNVHLLCEETQEREASSETDTKSNGQPERDSIVSSSPVGQKITQDVFSVGGGESGPAKEREPMKDE